MYDHAPERLLWPEILKIAAVFAAILIHTSAPLLINYNKIGLQNWWIGNLYDSAARWCIPVFVMMSGAFLIDKSDGHHIADYLRRRIRRVGVPLVAWSGIYYFWRIHANKENLPLTGFFTQVLTGPIYYHLWFLYILIGLYMLAPILGIYVRHAGRRALAYLIVLLFVPGSLLIFLKPMFDFSLYPPGATAEPLLAYVGYFVTGRALRNVNPTPLQRIVLTGAALAAIGATAWGTYHLTIVRSGGAFNDLLYDYSSINVAVMSLCIFLMAKGSGKPDVKTPLQHRGVDTVRFVAACVPGIYLVHAMIIGVLVRGMAGFSLSRASLPLALGVPVFAGAVFGISLFLVAIMKCIPLLRRIVP